MDRANKKKSSDSDSDSDTGPMEMEERVRCTYLIRRDPPHQNKRLINLRDRMKKPERNPDPYPMFRGRYDSDDEEYSASLQGRESPLLTTTFKRRDKEVLPIRHLVEKPGRYRRPNKIVIFIRGPLFSGKSFIAKSIIEREEFYGNTKAQRISGVKLVRRREDRDKDGPMLLFDEFHNAGKSDCKFLIVEIKSHKSSVLETCIHLARTYNYEMYGIDIMVNTESSIYKSKLSELRWYSYETLTSTYVKEMKAYPMPYYVTMLNPLSILPNSDTIPLLMNYIEDFAKAPNYGQPETCEDDYSAVDEAHYEITTAKDIYDYFPEGIRYSVNFEDDVIDKVGDLIVNKTEAPYMSAIDRHLQTFPSIDPKKVIDYEHKTEIIDDETILEVNPSIVIDYNHSRTQYLLSMVDDVDIDAVIEEKKAEKIEKNVKFYQQFEDEGTVISMYPQNWIKIHVQRPPLNGKRKKKKTKKIQKILDQNSIKTVQKGVKKMKIEDDDEFVDALMDIDSTVPYYIDEIIKKTTIDGQIEADYIRTVFTRLNAVPKMSVILDLVAQVDHLRIKFRMTDGNALCFNPTENLIEINVHNDADILRTLGHQLMHCAVHWTYNNNAKPYSEKNDDRKDELQRIFIGIDIIESEKTENFRKLMSKYCESSWDVEVVGLYGELMVDGRTDELKNVDGLWEFCDKMMMEIENFGNRFNSGSRRGVF
ncbi:uncharacterized protein [Chironomus tepperi]|uniref:uncharacterized protein n=1 Tax=Chironomus tepperi TaxID=113505 RepID=UPI00391FABB7